MKIVILDALALGGGVDLEIFNSLGDITVYGTTAPNEIAERVRYADVIITNKVRLGEEQLSDAENLKLICVTATGFDNIDIEYARKRRIGVCNVVDYSSASVAQITASMVLSLLSRQSEYRESVTSGEYSACGAPNILSPIYHEADGLKWGIIGYGSIGKRVARIADALGCEVLISKRTPCDEYRYVDVATLCRECDIITLHTPLNDGTRKLINAERISEMKDGVILVNVARGAVTDERAVADAVLSGKIGGFGCDVYSTEPFGAEHPFNEIKALQSVILTPHMAWGSIEARKRLLQEVKDNIVKFFDGKIKNRIDI